MSRLPGVIVLTTAFLGVAGALRGAAEKPHRASRTFDFTYEVSLKDLPHDAKSVRIWIPEAVSGPGQSVALEGVDGPVATSRTRDPEYGNRILYAAWKDPGASPSRFSVRYRVTRYEYTGEPDGEAGSRDLIARFLRPDALVPTGGKIKALADEITRGERDPGRIARSIYDYVFKNLRYEKTGTGWGRGDALWACDAKHGNCTDFHSLFIALMRAKKIPARFEIGFPLPPGASSGVIPGYHCWAEFHLAGKGWVPVDISEAWLTPSLHDYYFGHLDADRVELTVGRDITMSPPQHGLPLNYFVYPYVEVDGKPFASVATRFTFRDVPAGAAGSR